MKRITLLAFLLVFLMIPLGASGQSANDLINEVNALRSSYGLAPYTVDPNLMAAAQQHSEYQASIHQTTHERADGSGIPARSENVCGGIGVNASYCVKSMWTDDLHRTTMIGFSDGTVGAGYAQSEGNHYYTLMVNSSGSDTGLIKQESGSEYQVPIDPDSALLQPGEFYTATPMPDGSIYHTVRTNETLWSIALSYGITIAEIQALNGMEPDDTSVSIGQRILIVYVGNTVEPTFTPTITPLPATNTPKPTSTATNTPIPLPTLTPTPTNTPTPEPLIPHIRYFDTPGAKKLGLVLVIGCSVGLLATIFFGFIRKK
jgi:LysM repeat protein